LLLTFLDKKRVRLFSFFSFYPSGYFSYGGPQALPGGAKPYGTEVLIKLGVTVFDKALVAFVLFLFYPWGYFSYGGPQALPGGAKPDYYRSVDEAKALLYVREA
jgi:hypothetical protein